MRRDGNRPDPIEALRRIDALASALRDECDHPNVAAIVNIARAAWSDVARGMQVPDPRPDPDSFWRRWKL